MAYSRSSLSDHNKNLATELLREKNEEDWSTLGIIHHPGPVHENYITAHSRLLTYNLWPLWLSQSPKDLADAGFFYTRLSDRVKCFYCDGGLKSWETEDDPFKEHRKWFSGCAFVKLRGDQEESKTDLFTNILDILKLISLDETSFDKLETDETPSDKLKSDQLLIN